MVSLDPVDSVAEHRDPLADPGNSCSLRHAACSPGSAEGLSVTVSEESGDEAVIIGVHASEVRSSGLLGVEDESVISLVGLECLADERVVLHEVVVCSHVHPMLLKGDRDGEGEVPNVG